MVCQVEEICGGCSFRAYLEADYQTFKIQALKQILQTLPVSEIKFGQPIFVGDGARRRATFAFQFHKGKLTLGFNRRHSDELVDIETCPLLNSPINQALPALRQLLSEFCQIPLSASKKKGKSSSRKAQHINQGDLAVCAADNGLDVVLEFDGELGLEHKLALFDWSQTQNQVIRISHRRRAFDTAEVLLEKAKPQIMIGGVRVCIPAGTFLQATSLGEEMMVQLVLKYLGNTRGQIGDLFCGVGTFSYPLSQLKGNKILAIDSSTDSLAGFQATINQNQLTNIELQERNLFKYPLEGKELEGFDAIVFDPPRAGALAQMQAVAGLSLDKRPAKIIAVSCNPHSFVKDAAVLLGAGYLLQEVTLVDQFAYSNHSELVALFTLNS